MNELETKIAALRKTIFYLDMKDRWNDRDYDNSRKWNAELLALEKQLAAMKTGE